MWRPDRWGRSVTDLLATLQELKHLGDGFVSLTEALDLTTPAGRAMAGLLAIFAEFEREVRRERTRAGLGQARQKGKRLGRPETCTRVRSGSCSRRLVIQVRFVDGRPRVKARAPLLHAPIDVFPHDKISLFDRSWAFDRIQ